MARPRTLPPAILPPPTTADKAALAPLSCQAPRRAATNALSYARQTFLDQRLHAAMLDQPLGFHAKAPLSAWNQRLGVDYPGVFKALLKAALAAATANAPGAISAAIDGFFAFKVEDSQAPSRGAGLALDPPRPGPRYGRAQVEAARRHGTPLQDKDELVAAHDRALDSTEIWIDPDFFDRPAEHPIVGAVSRSSMNGSCTSG